MVTAPPLHAIYSRYHKGQMPMCRSPWDARCVKNLLLAQTLHGQIQLLPPCGWGEHKPGWFTQCEWPPRNILALLHQTEGYSLLLGYPVTPFHNSPLFVRIKMPAVNYTGHFSLPVVTVLLTNFLRALYLKWLQQWQEESLESEDMDAPF